MWYGRGFDRLGGCFGYTSWGPWIMGGLWLLAIIALIVVVVKRQGKASKSDANKALEQLKLRYVSGEITEDQYNKMKSVLKD